MEPAPHFNRAAIVGIKRLGRWTEVKPGSLTTGVEGGIVWCYWVEPGQDGAADSDRECRIGEVQDFRVDPDRLG